MQGSKNCIDSRDLGVASLRTGVPKAMDAMYGGYDGLCLGLTRVTGARRNGPTRHGPLSYRRLGPELRVLSSQPRHCAT